MPNKKALIDKTDKLNYLLVFETSVNNFTMGDCMKDALMGIKRINKVEQSLYRF
jgi:hypothetical protein